MNNIIFFFLLEIDNSSLSELPKIYQLLHKIDNNDLMYHIKNPIIQK